MKRRIGWILLVVSVAIACVSGGLIAWRLTMMRRAAEPSSVAVAPQPEAPKTQTPARISGIIDLPGDPVLIRRGAVSAPKALLIAVPPKLTPDAIKPGSPDYAVRQAYFVNSALLRPMAATWDISRRPGRRPMRSPPSSP